MTLTQLSYVVAVDKYKNFGSAAESCKITQPTLSMQIQKLEEQLGVIFFDRSQQPVKTTKIGESLIAQARIVLSEAQRFQDIINDDKGVAKGEIEIGIIPTLAPYLLPLFIHQFSEKHPELKIKIHELQTHEILQRLHQNTLDIGLLVTPLEDDKLKTQLLFYEPFLIYTSDKNLISQKQKINQSDLNSNDLWLLTEGHCFRDQTLAVCKSRKKVSEDGRNIKFESGSLETLMRMVDEESGFTLIPQLAALKLPGSKKIKEFSNPVPHREVSLIYSTYFRREAIKNSLVDVIQSRLPKEISVSLNKNAQIIDLPIGKNVMCSMGSVQLKISIKSNDMKWDFYIKWFVNFKFIFVFFFLISLESRAILCEWPKVVPISSGSLVSTYTFHYWNFAKSVETYFPKNLLQEGYVVGDFQFNNINFFLNKNSNRAHLVISDLDDSGHASLIADYVKYVSYIYEQYGNLKDKTTLGFYVKGLKKEKILTNEIPVLIRENLVESKKYFDLADQVFAEKKISKKKNKFESKQDLKSISSLTVENKEAIKKALLQVPQYKILDSGYKYNLSGSSKDLLRVLFLAKPQGQYKIFELKKVRCSALENFKKQDDLTTTFLDLAEKFDSREYWSESFFVSTAKSNYLFRTKRKNYLEDIEFEKMKLDEAQEYINYFSYYLGQLHSKSASIEYADYIESHLPEVSERVKKMSLDYLTLVRKEAQ